MLLLFILQPVIRHVLVVLELALICALNVSLVTIAVILIIALVRTCIIRFP